MGQSMRMNASFGPLLFLCVFVDRKGHPCPFCNETVNPCTRLPAEYYLTSRILSWDSGSLDSSAGEGGGGGGRGRAADGVRGCVHHPHTTVALPGGWGRGCAPTACAAAFTTPHTTVTLPGWWGRGGADGVRGCVHHPHTTVALPGGWGRGRAPTACAAAFATPATQPHATGVVGEGRRRRRARLGSPPRPHNRHSTGVGGRGRRRGSLRGRVHHPRHTTITGGGGGACLQNYSPVATFTLQQSGVWAQCLFTNPKWL